MQFSSQSSGIPVERQVITKQISSRTGFDKGKHWETQREGAQPGVEKSRKTLWNRRLVKKSRMKPDEVQRTVFFRACAEGV